MILIKSVIVLSFAAATLASYILTNNPDYELKFVTFLHRHGDRSPVGTYPNDPYGSESLWNNGWGQLTNAGKVKTYKLGQKIRKTYAGFLPLIYNQKDYEVQSTDVSRTLMSAYLVLAGLYEPVGGDIWNSDIKWQPIPVHTTPRNMDNVLAATKPCPKHALLLTKLMFSEEMTKTLKSWELGLTEVAAHAGYNSTSPLVNLFLAGSIYDSLLQQDLNGYVLPQWTNLYFPYFLRQVNSLILRLPTYNRSLQRLSCGLLVKDILTHFKQVSTGSMKKKMWQYSAHDITIVGLKQCLGLESDDPPPFASTIFLELSSSERKYYVRILFQEYGFGPRTLVIPDCSEYCPLETFEKLVQPIIPEDWEAECKDVKT